MDRETNEYFGDNHMQFLIESLKDLDKALSAFGSRLFYFHGPFDQIFRKMVIEMRPQAVFINSDVTPTAKANDKAIEEICKQHCAKFFSFDDITILNHDCVVSKARTCFKVFNSYFRAASKATVPPIEKNSYTNYQSKDVSYQCEFSASQIDEFYIKNEKLEIHGGRQEGLKKLANMDKFKNYRWVRDYPKYETTQLSAYMKCGCLSPREVYHKAADVLGKRSGLVKQLFWRDFFTNLIRSYPEYLEKSMKPQYQYVEYENNQEFFQKWKDGMTGIPFVDAAMRKLNATGFLINNLRSVAGHVLVMDLLVDWRLGEKYFASKLVDFDPATSNGGWQLCAGTGVQRRRWLKVPNPWRQSAKYDKNAEFIKKWIPELKQCDPKDLHNWEKGFKKYPKVNYPRPIIKHADQAKKTMKVYKDSAMLHRKRKSEAKKSKKGSKMGRKQAVSESESEEEEDESENEEDDGSGSDDDDESSGSEGSDDEEEEEEVKEKSSTKKKKVSKGTLNDYWKVGDKTPDVSMDIEEESKSEAKKERSKSSKSKTPTKVKKKEKEETKKERSSSAKKSRTKSQDQDKEKEKKPRKSSTTKDSRSKTPKKEKTSEKKVSSQGKGSKRKKPVSSEENSENEIEVVRKSVDKAEVAKRSVDKKLDREDDANLHKIPRTMHTPDVRKHRPEENKISTKSPSKLTERKQDDEIIDLPKTSKPKANDIITIDNIDLFKFGWNKPNTDSQNM